MTQIQSRVSPNLQAACSGTAALEPTTGRVLVVDDDDVVAQGYRRLLRSRGFSAESAESGPRALSLLGDRDFDVLLADFAMPGMNGIELLRRVRQQDLDMPVVLITGAPGLESAIEAVEHGAMRYLLKPVDHDLLVTTLSDAVRLNQVTRLQRCFLEQNGMGIYCLRDRASLETEMARAQDEMWIAFQPIVRGDSGALFGFEALVRTRGNRLKSPADLIAAAERLGCIEHLGRAIRRRVAACLPGIPSELAVFVNLHPYDLRDAELFRADAPLSRHSDRLILEVTERVSLGDIDGVSRRIDQLRAMGYRIALDDLGQGYAGLSSFVSLAPDIVKLDMSLIRGITENPLQQKLVRSMVSLCTDLGSLVVAEGIETVGERAMASDLGCHLLQGYHLGRPTPLPTSMLVESMRVRSKQASVLQFPRYGANDRRSNSQTPCPTLSGS